MYYVLLLRYSALFISFFLSLLAALFFSLKSAGRLVSASDTDALWLGNSHLGPSLFIWWSDKQVNLNYTLG